MKKLLFMALSLCCFCASCSSSDNNPEQHKEIVLSRRSITVDSSTPVVKIEILDGNGGYRIRLPKQLYKDQEMIEYSEDILKLDIEHNIVTITRKISDEFGFVSGCFLIEDSKKMKRVLFVQTELTVGLIDFDLIEKSIANDNNYWLTK